MEKEILLAIKGMQFAMEGEETEGIETITWGEYYRKKDSHYVMYEEISEGSSDVTKNIVKFKEASLEVTKKGLVNVHMVFEAGKRNMTSYSTPFGNILIGIDTESVEVREAEDCIQVYVKYALEVNYEHMADCDIEIRLTPRKKEVRL